MRELAIRDWKLVAGMNGSSSYSPTTIPQPLFVSCVKRVFILVISGVLNTLKTVIYLVVCVSGWFVNSFWTAFTTAFAPLFRSTFNQLNSALVHFIHITNNYNNDLYKLIITN